MCTGCKAASFRESEKRYTCTECNRVVWKDGLLFRGIPMIHRPQALRLLAGNRVEFTCVARSTGKPYQAHVMIGIDGKLSVELAKRKSAPRQQRKAGNV